MMTRFRLILTLSVGVVFAYLTSFTPPSSAEIPQVIAYQGKVTDTGGMPVADGNYTMRFRIYDDATSGTMEWDSGNQSIQVTGGIFDVLLGESPQPPISLPFDEDYWLLVTIAGDDQTPRQRLESVGYAYMASGLVPGTEINGSVASGTSAALKAVNTAPTGTRYGVYGQSTATEGWMYGVFGICASTIGRGVYGEASATSGNAFGVLGVSRSTIGRGVFGQALATTGQNYGVYGMTSSPTGYAGYFQGDAKVTGDLTVDGVITASGLGDITAVSAGTGLDGGGTSGDVTLDVEVPFSLTGSVVDNGVIHATNSASGGYGLYGEASASTGISQGVHGVSESTVGTGVIGLAFASSGQTFGGGFRSLSTSGTGVIGEAYAYSGTNFGVYGLTNSGSGYGVYYQGGLAGTGTKSCVVKTSRGPILLYCQESPENWFEDFGEGQLVDGRAHIELDPLFLETVTIDHANPMKVFVQLHDRNCKGVAVEKGLTGFDVVELQDGSSNGSFDYRIVAKRKGFEKKRLDYCAAAENDSYLYPELREKERREFEEERSRMQADRN